MSRTISGFNSPLRAATAAAVTLIATVTVAALLSTTAAAHEGFIDVSDRNTHHNSIDALVHAGVFEGTLCGDSRFCPWDSLSRAHMAVWLVRVVDGSDPAPVTATRFVDVAGTHPQAAFIERFAALGITEGCETDPLSYCPDEHVPRAQMASFLVRAFKLAPAGEPAGFADVAAGGAHTANIDTLAAIEITVGCDTDPLQFCPWDDVSRAQMASFLVKAETTTTAPPDDEWVEPYVGYVPDVHPDTPPPGWERGNPTGRGRDDVPRSTGEDREVVAGWIAWMPGGGYTDWLLHNMKWALDYLGAHPDCVINQYYNRVDALEALNLAPGRAEPYYLRNDHGWHNCATVIDPFLAGVELPAGRSDDVGLRLSDTPGITLAEKCRAVLPDDIKLESYRGGIGSIDHFGHAGCDAWAEWITTRHDYGRFTQCRESAFLAEEWMEHYRGQPDNYIEKSC